MIHSNKPVFMILIAALALSACGGSSSGAQVSLVDIAQAAAR